MGASCGRREPTWPQMGPKGPMHVLKCYYAQHSGACMSQNAMIYCLPKALCGIQTAPRCSQHVYHRGFWRSKTLHVGQRRLKMFRVIQLRPQHVYKCTKEAQNAPMQLRGSLFPQLAPMVDSQSSLQRPSSHRLPHGRCDHW